MIDEEENDTEGGGVYGKFFVWLIQLIWEHVSIPQQMQQLIVVLLPKGVGIYHGIGLLEPF